MLIFIWFVCIAFLWNEGMWSNCLTLINVLLAALVAMNYFEPVADFLDEKQPSYTYLWDYLSMWFIFFIAFAIARTATGLLSRTRVKFIPQIEQAGRVISVLLIGWILVCFALCSLHTAPLARTAVRGEFQAQPMSNNFLGIAPDRFWLGYIQHRSKNALATSGPNVFDENAEYIFKYGERRRKFSELEAVRVNK